MPRPRRNPFYVILGVVGFLFTITATSYCVAVLRGVRPAAGPVVKSGLEGLMDRHGTSILVGELVVLAIATVGAIAMDQNEGSAARKPGPPRPSDDQAAGAP